jgi:tetratricopeptide (TPR) repeat protein
MASEIRLKFLNDNPVGHDQVKDSASRDDRLDFASFINPLAHRILASDQHNTPLTIGIFAQWGMGKSSIMHMLQQRLKDECHTVWFDPWKYHSREEVWKGLALELVHKITRHDSAKKQFQRRLPAIKLSLAKLLWDRLLGKPGATLVHAAQQEPWSPDFLHQFEENIGQLISEVTRAEDSGASKKPRKRLVVLFIDDLDRCLPDAAATVLEALKLVLNQPNMIVVMGIAEQELSRAVYALYSKLLNTDREKLDPEWGKRYIEKLIQIPFPVPQVTSASFLRYVRHCLGESAVDQLLERPEVWAQIIRDASGANFRDVKRLINQFISEWDKGQANTNLNGSSQLEPGRVALMIVLNRRFSRFIDHCRADPGLFVRYQSHFLKLASGEVALDEEESQTLTEAFGEQEDDPFHRSEALAELFATCFYAEPSEQPLVSSFESIEEARSYFEFGLPPGPVSQTTSTSEAETTAEPPPTKPADHVSDRVLKALEQTHQLLGQNQLDEAEAVAAKALKITKSREEPLGSGKLQLLRAEIRLKQRNLRWARQYVAEALAAGIDHQDRDLELAALSLKGQIELAAGHPAEAQEPAAQALSLARAIGDSRAELEALETLATINQQRGELDEAKNYIHQALEIAESNRFRKAELRLRLVEAKTERLRGDLGAAYPIYQEVQKLADSLNIPNAEFDALLQLAELEQERGNRASAESQLQRAAEIATKIDDPLLYAQSQIALGEVMEEMEMIEAAAQCYREAMDATQVATKGLDNPAAQALQGDLKKRLKRIDYLKEQLPE